MGGIIVDTVGLEKTLLVLLFLPYYALYGTHVDSCGSRFHRPVKRCR